MEGAGRKAEFARRATSIGRAIHYVNRTRRSIFRSRARLVRRGALLFGPSGCLRLALPLAVAAGGAASLLEAGRKRWPVGLNWREGNDAFAFEV